MKFPNIALIGGMGSGKSTILGRLIERYGYTRLSWADPVKELARLAYGHIEKNQLYNIVLPSGKATTRRGREILQRIGTDALREQVDADFWIKAGLRRMDDLEREAAKTGEFTGRHTMRWVNDDTRFRNEVSALRVSREFAIVQLVVPNNERAKRLGITETALHELSQHPSEVHIQTLDVDLIVENVDPPNEVAQRILEHLTELLAA